jgi:hypothetical protein
MPCFHKEGTLGIYYLKIYLLVASHAAAYFLFYWYVLLYFILGVEVVRSLN